jgi:putative endopeptidase
MEVAHETNLIVGQPEFFAALDNDVASTSLDELKAYLRWNVVNTFAAFMAPAFEDENFAFNGVILNGQKQQRPRWKRVLDAQEGFLGDALGQLYVKKYYSEKTKKRYERLTENILAAYKDRIERVPWLAQHTKELAVTKLAKVRRKVGYPKKWKDYSSMQISRDSFVQNAMQANTWAYYYGVKKLGQAVDRDEWGMTPQTYNAYYNPSNNEIVLPAAIFIIPGLDDEQADDAIIYGYAGASTIGHEITHGFDDQGHQYDSDGNLLNWWTQSDTDAFNKATQLYVDQFNNYVVLGNMHVNGKATLGENIADLGGLVNGLEAFKKTEQYKNNVAIAGLTPLQRFFLGYALGWMMQERDEALAKQILTDVHAPAFLRVNGPLSNIPEFYEAFGVKPGDALYRAENIRVKIW